jgi:hypothetical protein
MLAPFKSFAGFTLELPVALTAVDETVVKITTHNRIMAKTEGAENTGVYVFTPDGRLEHFLRIPGQASLVDFVHSPWDHAYFLSTLRDESRYELLIFDESNGSFIGNGYIQDGSDWVKERDVREGPLFRQAIVAGDRLFFSNWTEGEQFKNPLLQETRMTPLEDGFKFEKIGKPFSRQVGSSRLFEGSYSQRWIAKKGEDLLVMDQLQPRVWLYGENGNTKKVNQKSINLQYRNFPYDDDPISQPFKSSNFNKWFFSFTRVQGFYGLDSDSFVVGYNSPNKNHKWYLPDPLLPEPKIYKYSDEGDEKPYLLQLVKLDKNLEQDGKTLTLEGYFLLGSRGSEVLVWKSKALASSDGKPHFEIAVESILSSEFERSWVDRVWDR